MDAYAAAYLAEQRRLSDLAFAGQLEDLSQVQAGNLRVGTMTPLGRIERVSQTSYLIDGVWHHWFAIHGRPAPVEPLVSFRS